MKGRVALFAAYFVGVLLIASWLTGIFQEGVITTLLRSSGLLRHDSTSAVSGSTERTTGESEGEAPPPAPSDSTRLTTGSVEGPSPSQVDRPIVSLPQDQTLRPDSGQIPRDPGRVALPLNSEQAPFGQAQDRLRPGSGQERAQCDTTLGSEREAVHKALEAKWAELDRLEERLRRQREQNLTEERWLAKMKSSRVTGSKDARQEAGIMKLAKLYEGMEPEAAAAILGALEKELATNVLASMKDRQASKVLGAMNGPRARELSERLHEGRADRPHTGELNE